MKTFLMALAFATACGGAAATDPAQVTFAGTYALQSVNGSKLPYVAIQDASGTVIIVADQLVIADGGSWSESGTIRTTINGQTQTQVGGNSGSWTRSGNSLFLYSVRTNTNSYAGTFSQNRLDMVDGGASYVFTK